MGQSSKENIDEVLGRYFLEKAGHILPIAAPFTGDLVNLGQAMIAAVDQFITRDCETNEEASGIFEFVMSEEDRKKIVATFLRARWMQKLGVLVARNPSRPGYLAQLRAQIIEYGALVETLLRSVWHGNTAAPDTFENLINSSHLKAETKRTAHDLRASRNRVHLHLEPLLGDEFVRIGAEAFANLVIVVNDLRLRNNLNPWSPGTNRLGA